HHGEAAVLVGERQPAEVHALGHLINESLGAFGATLRLVPDALTPAPGSAGIAQLLRDIRAGAVDTLIITAHDPVGLAPAELELAQAIASIDHAVYLGLYEDETARASAWSAPAAHSFEQWSDGRALDGTASVAQPLLLPMYDELFDPLRL